MGSWDKLTLSISKIPNSFKNMESGSCPKTTHSCSLTLQISLIQLPQTSAAIPHTVSHKGSHFQINSFTTNTEETGFLLWPFRDQWMLSRNRGWNSQRNQGSHKEGPEFYTRAQNLERKSHSQTLKMKTFTETLRGPWKTETTNSWPTHLC